MIPLLLRPLKTAALFSLILLAGCASDDSPMTVSLEQLVAMASGYEGQIVRTRGVVRTFDEPLHYWIEDDDYNRVGLVPHDMVAHLVGETLWVEGRFHFVEGEGRRISLNSVEGVTQ